MAAKRKFSTVLATLLATVITAGAFTAVAEAGWPEHGWSYVSSNTGSANIRTCPNTGCKSIYTLRNGYRVGMRCYADSQWAVGNYRSNRWFKVYFATGPGTGDQAFIHSSLVTSQTPTKPC